MGKEKMGERIVGMKEILKTILNDIITDDFIENLTIEEIYGIKDNMLETLPADTQEILIKRRMYLELREDDSEEEKKEIYKKLNKLFDEMKNDIKAIQNAKRN